MRESPGHNFVRCDDGCSDHEAGCLVAAFEGRSVSHIEEAYAFLAVSFDESHVIVVMEKEDFFPGCGARLDRLDGLVLKYSD